MRYLLIISLFLQAFMVLAEDEKPLVVATASMWADMAENLAGSFIKIETIVNIGGDPHTYEPTPADALLAIEANLILRNGLTFEGWLNELIDNSGTKAMNILVTEGITPITSQSYENAPDPHAWMNGPIWSHLYREYQGRFNQAFAAIHQRDNIQLRGLSTADRGFGSFH